MWALWLAVVLVHTHKLQPAVSIIVENNYVTGIRNPTGSPVVCRSHLFSSCNHHCHLIWSQWVTHVRYVIHQVLTSVLLALTISNQVSRMMAALYTGVTLTGGSICRLNMCLGTLSGWTWFLTWLQSKPWTGVPYLSVIAVSYYS